MNAPIVGHTHYTKLVAPSDRPPDDELVTYIREVGRLIAEGHEGKWALISKSEIAGVFATEKEAIAEGYRRFGIHSFRVHHIQEFEPIYRFHAWK